jgi:hypothetical protein
VRLQILMGLGVNLEIESGTFGILSYFWLSDKPGTIPLLDPVAFAGQILLERGQLLTN